MNPPVGALQAFTFSQLHISLFAVFVSFLALLWTMISSQRQKMEARALANLAQSIAVEQRLSELPAALRFHGIDLADLEAIGLTPAEFAYLVNSFTLGRIYYSGKHANRKVPFKKGSYRYQMCESKDVRRAWPLLRRMLADSGYRDAIEATINALNAEQNPDATESMKELSTAAGHAVRTPA